MSQLLLNIAEICFLVTCVAGPYVAKNAKSNESPMIIQNCSHGNTNVKVLLVKTSCWANIVSPITIPVNMPRKLAATTRMKAS